MEKSDTIEIPDDDEDDKENFPHPSFQNYFELYGKKHEKPQMFYAKCKLCAKNKPLSISITSALNLRKHIEVRSQTIGVNWYEI